MVYIFLPHNLPLKEYWKELDWQDCVGFFCFKVMKYIFILYFIRQYKTSVRRMPLPPKFLKDPFLQ